MSSDEKTKLTNELIEKGYIEKEDDIQGMVEVCADNFTNTASATFDLSKVATSGERVAILHYDETNDRFDVVKLAYVGDDLSLDGSLKSFSPIISVKVTDYNHDEILMLQPGLYDANEKLIVKWEDSGIDASKAYYAYDSNSLYVGRNEMSPYCKLKDKYTTASIAVVPTDIGQFAFAWCTELKKVYITDSVENIVGWTFCGCMNLEKIIVSKNNPVFDGRDNCNGVMETAKDKLVAACKYTTYPEGIKEIGRGVFQSYTDFTNSDIPDTVVSIGENAFECTAITTLDIPESVVNVGSQAFDGCSSLREVTIGSNVEILGVGEFDADPNLTKVTFKNKEGWSVTKLNTWAISVTKDDIPDSAKGETTTITSSTLSNTSNNASLLNSTYCRYYYWSRN